MRRLWCAAGACCLAWACSLNPQPLPPDSPPDLGNGTVPSNVEAGTPEGVIGAADAAFAADSASRAASDSGRVDGGNDNAAGGQPDASQSPQPGHDGGEGGAVDAPEDALNEGGETGEPAEAGPEASTPLED